MAPINIQIRNGTIVQPRSQTRAVVEPSVLVLVRRDSRPRNEKGPVSFDGPLHLAGGLGFEPR
jgi:hypothetical protein